MPNSIRTWVGALALCTLACKAVAATPLMETIGGEQPIRLQSIDINSEIGGSTAETTVKMVFYNPNHRPLEGNLQFPLAAGQQIVGFSLDINGKLRAAVPVEKEKGRQVFEEIERRRADPALLEVTQGNNFKLRVFPVPAGGTRTVELKYAEVLALRGADWDYHLPLAYESGTASFSLALKVDGVHKAPRLESPIHGLTLEPEKDGYGAHVARQAMLTGVLDVLLPAQKEAHAYVQEFHGERYFLAEVPVSTERKPRDLPHLVGLLWDSSGSGAKRNLAAELAVLDAYFARFADGDVHLTRLRDRPEAAKVFHVSRGDWSALRKELEATVYDGASALADWKPERGVSEYLLFSDGLLNYGGNAFPAMGADQRLYALDAAASDDAARLAAWAEHAGGRYIKIDPRAPQDAARELISEGVRLAGMHAEGATALESETPYPAQGLLRLAGKLNANTATLHLDLGSAGRIDVPVAADAPAHPLAAYNWAAYRLRALQAERETRRAEIRRIGLQFGIPTAETSLIVLETVEDYLRYDIEAPVELREAFDQRRGMQNQSRMNRLQNDVDALVRAFEERQIWWNTKFPTWQPDQKVKPNAYPSPMQVRPDMPTTVVPSVAPSMAAPPLPVAPVRSTARSPSNTVVIEGQPIRRTDTESASPVQVITAQSLAAGSSAGFASDSPRQAAPAASPALNAYSSDEQARLAENVQRVAVTGASSRKKEASSEERAGIALKPWVSNAEYITRMKQARADDLYAIYLDEKPGYANSSAFYLDVADILFEKGRRDLGLRVLSNLAEMDLENRQVLRILGYRLMEAGVPELAIPVLQKVLQLAPDEPQSFRDLGLAYAAAGRYQEAIDQLNEVASRPADPRFGDIALIAVGELNAIAATHNSVLHPLDLSHIDPRLLKNLPLDLRVVMNWDADDSDMDLWVTDPSGERCFYQNTLTHQGGRISRDVTQGYGPEEFILHHAAPGKYRIEANFYGNRQQVVAGATTVQVKLTTGFGTSHAQDKMMTLRLRDRGDTVYVGEFEVK